MQFGEHIRNLREAKGLLQRQLSAKLEIDTPMYSKIERGERRAKREQVNILADFLGAPHDELLTIWLADQVIELIKDEPQATDALKIALKEIKKL
jgi:transcriptional regulator with XRE-family HTH domain